MISAEGPIGIPGYDLWIADYPKVGGLGVAAPGGDYFQAAGTVQDAVIGAVPMDGALWADFDPLDAVFPGTTTIDGGGGTSFSTGPGFRGRTNQVVWGPGIPWLLGFRRLDGWCHTTVQPGKRMQLNR